MEYFSLGSVLTYCPGEYTWNENYLRAIASCCLLGLHYLNTRNLFHGVGDDGGAEG